MLDNSAGSDAGDSGHGRLVIAQTRENKHECHLFLAELLSARRLIDVEFRPSRTEVFVEQSNSTDRKLPLALAALHVQISECRRCEAMVPNLHRAQVSDRGDPGRVMIVGQGPGRKEMNTQRAFAGQSGTRLDSWLRQCGAATDNPRAGIYLTSVTKCTDSNAKNAPSARMIQNCRPFLFSQMRILNPTLVISLGKVAYETLRRTPDPYSKALCRIYDTSEQDLFEKYRLLVWPHPSGLNHWLNNPENLAALNSSFQHVREALSSHE